MGWKDAAELLIVTALGGAIGVWIYSGLAGKRLGFHTTNRLIAGIRNLGRRRSRSRQLQDPADQIAYCHLGHPRGEHGEFGLAYVKARADGADRRVAIDGEYVRASEMTANRRYVYMRLNDELLDAFAGRSAVAAVEYRLLDRSIDSGDTIPSPHVSLRFESTTNTYEQAELAIARTEDNWHWAGFVLNDPAFAHGQGGADLRITVNNPRADVDYEFAARRVVLTPLPVTGG